MLEPPHPTPVVRLSPQKETEFFEQIVTDISSELELQPLLTKMIRYACELIEADCGSVGLVDKARNLVRTEAVFNMPAGELGAEMPRGVGLAGSVLQSQQILHLHRYADLDNPTLSNVAEDAVLGIPVHWQDEMIGFLGIGMKPPKRFSEATIKTMQRFARHAAIAIRNAQLFATNARLYHDMQSALDEMQLLYDSSRRISMALDVDGVVKAYLEQVAANRNYRCSIVYFELEQGVRKYIKLLGNWAPQQGMSTEELYVPYFKDSFDDILDAGETITMSDVARDPRASATLKQAQAERGYPALALIPLMSHGERIGVISLSTTVVHPWSAADLRPYQVTAAQLALAIESRLQQQQLFAGEQQLALVEERQRLARELHDSVSQVIFSMTLIAQTIGNVMQRDPMEGQARVDKLYALSQKARAEMRALLAELRPSNGSPSMRYLPDQLKVREYGLARALQSTIEDISTTGPLIVLEAQEYQRSTLVVEQMLFRVAQEALHNALKHAEACTITIHLWQDTTTTYLSIQDDGKGFELGKVSEHKGRQLGLNTMRERAEGLHADFHVYTEMGKGCHIMLSLAHNTPNIHDAAIP